MACNRCNSSRQHVICCKVHVMRWYYMVYIMSRFITWLIASCLNLLHDRLHPAWIGLLHPVLNHYMRHYVRHYMLPNPLHPLHAPESITCGQCSLLSINWQRAGPSAAAQRSLCRPAGATKARGKQSFFCWILFARPDSACSDRTCSDEVAASTRSLRN
jgi:hypothetical protein